MNRSPISVLLLATLCASSASVAHAQVPCLEGPYTVYSGTFRAALFVSDLDADGDVDVGYGGGIVKRFDNDGSGLFQYVTPDIVSMPAGGGGNSYLFANLDGDAFPDLAYVDSISQQLIVVLHTTFGTFGAGTAYPTQPGPGGLAVGDVDNDGDQDLFVTNTTSNSFTPFFNNGSGSYASSGPQVSYSTAASPAQPKLADLNGDGNLDLVMLHVGAQSISIFHGNGNGTFNLPVMLPTGSFVTAFTLGDLNGDGRQDLVISYGGLCGGPGCVPEFRVRLQLPGGVLAAPMAFSLGCQGLTVELGDVDTDGDLDALAAGLCTNEYYVALGNGDGTFQAPASLLTVGFPPNKIKVADVDGDGDNDVITYQSLFVSSINENHIEIFRSCVRAGAPYCAGDGSAATCPCGNSSAPGAKVGCLSSLALGGSLRAIGAATLTNDSVALRGTQMPNSAVLYFQGSALVSAGTGVAFGDGLRCAGGATVRLGTKINAGGASSYPVGADAPVHVKGALIGPGTAYYQAWYRDSISYCTGAGYNLTNGLSLRWTP